MPLDLFLPFGGLLQSIFRLRDNSEAVGVRKESINDLAVVEESEIVELDDEDGVLGTGVESKSPASSPGYLLLRSPLRSLLLVSNNSTSESVSSSISSSDSPLTTELSTYKICMSEVMTQNE